MITGRVGAPVVPLEGAHQPRGSGVPGRGGGVCVAGVPAGGGSSCGVGVGRVRRQGRQNNQVLGQEGGPGVHQVVPKGGEHFPEPRASI
jgi:hypothetical protein